jgi:hypothetical protein
MSKSDDAVYRIFYVINQDRLQFQPPILAKTPQQLFQFLRIRVGELPGIRLDKTLESGPTRPSRMLDHQFGHGLFEEAGNRDTQVAREI